MLNCQTCGACCASTWESDTYVYVGVADLARLRESLGEVKTEALVGHIDDNYERGLKVKRNKQGAEVCKALDGEIGRECTCSIYDSRPAACRRFDVDSIGCQFARKAAGLGDDD